MAPSSEWYHDTKLPYDIYVLQAHTSWLQEVYQFLSLEKSSGDEVPGSDAQNTKYAFAELA